MKKIKLYSVKALIISVLIFSSSSIWNCSGASPELSEYRNALKIQMQTMLNTLNGAHYSQFMQNYVEPSYISKVGGLDQAVIQFDNKKQKEVYTMLQFAKNIEPLYSSKSKLMTYIDNSMPIPVTFRMVNGKWYLTGDMFQN
ncbi:MAG: hypothetical protein IPM96_02215 [Ignavibacteria bacterium]|nr:hypothetical protein [Ignavibacteria bacterium]